MRYLLERAGLTYEQDVQSVTQHVYNEEPALLRVILLTEAASKSFFQSLRVKRPYWAYRIERSTFAEAARIVVDAILSLEKKSRESL